MKILVFEIFEKGQILRPFSGLAAPSKLKIFSKKFNGSICAYRVFYLKFSGKSKGGVESTPQVLAVPKKKRGPERNKQPKKYHGNHHFPLLFEWVLWFSHSTAEVFVFLNLPYIIPLTLFQAGNFAAYSRQGEVVFDPPPKF